MLAHTLRVLETLAFADAPIRLQDLATRIGVSKSSVFRIVATLHAHGFLWRDDASNGYRLGERMFELADMGRRGDAMRDRARAQLQALHRRFGETVNLGALRGNRLVYVDVLESGHAFRMVTPPGSDIPPHASALGKAILAFQPDQRVSQILDATGLERLTSHTITDRKAFLQALARVRRTGFATDKEEVEIGAFCVAAPIRQADGSASYAISISGPTGRMAEHNADITAALLKCVRLLGATTGKLDQG